MEIKGVKIGDKFKKQLAKSKYSICEVVNFVERKSIATGEIIDYECWAKSTDNKITLTGSFEVAFSTVKLNKIN